VRHEEVHQRPQFHEAVLQRRAGQQQPTLAVEVEQRLPALRLEVLYVLGLLRDIGARTSIGLIRRSLSHTPVLITDNRHTVTGWPHKVGEKNSPSFPGFFQSHNYTFPQVIATKSKVSPRLGLDKIVSNYVTDYISQQNFTQSTVV